MAGGKQVRLRGEPDVYHSLVHSYQVVEAKGDRGPWKVQTEAYYYNADGPDGREIFAYHWHPSVPDVDTRPHVHLHDWAGRDNVRLPTSRVSIEDVIRLLILEFKITPLREDWSTVLDDTQDRFVKYRGWG